MSDPIDQPWGFWVRIRDDESARYAARMSGLPVFLGGVMTALVATVDPGPSSSRQLAFYLVAILFITSGLLIKRGWYGLIPFVALLMIVNLIAALVTSSALAYGLSRIDAIPSGMLLVEFVRLIAFPVLFLIMLVSGLRGWWWLRRRKNNKG